MDPSIAQPSAKRRRALRRLLRELETALALASAAASVSDGVTATAFGDFVARLRAIDAAADWPDPEGARVRLPVCRFWEAALQSVPGTARVLADTLGVLAPALSWVQNPNYRRRPPDASFLDDYGYAVIAGPVDGPLALAVDARLALGVLLLGPRTHYPLHAHPAVEVYYTLTPGGEWWRDAGPWRTEPPGAAIYHAPNVPHATRAGAEPLLAIYVWAGDLGTHARLA
jgi:hypothetical protein